MRLASIAFPFYKSRHSLLMERWYFRAALVSYLIALLSGFLYISYAETRSYYANCSDQFHYLIDAGIDYDEINSVHVDCIERAERTARPIPLYVGITVIVAHFVIQFIFFVVIIDFIVQPGRERRPS